VDLAGSHAVIFGPGDLRDAHRPDESISLTDVLTCAEILARIVVVPRDLFGGDA
jgi:acetylornithine deacetylase/succinyl-diaminopimelate desuccinylase-like protein